MGFGHKVYKNPIKKGLPPLTEDNSLTYSEGFGCTWLYSTLCLSPSGKAVAPCCGTWSANYFQPIESGLKHSLDVWSTNTIMNARRSQSYKNAKLPYKKFLNWQLANAKNEDSMV